MIRRIRRLFGLALIAWSAWTIVRACWPRPALYGVDADTGEATGLRVNGLSPAETRAALELEDRLRREWLAPGPAHRSQSLDA